MLYWIKNMSTTFILVIDVWNNGFKSIKMTYQFFIWIFFGQIINKIKEDKAMNISSEDCLMEII